MSSSMRSWLLGTTLCVSIGCGARSADDRSTSVVSATDSPAPPPAHDCSELIVWDRPPELLTEVLAMESAPPTYSLRVAFSGADNFCTQYLQLSETHTRCFEWSGKPPGPLPADARQRMLARDADGELEQNIPAFVGEVLDARWEEGERLFEVSALFANQPAVTLRCADRGDPAAITQEWAVERGLVPEFAARALAVVWTEGTALRELRRFELVGSRTMSLELGGIAPAAFHDRFLAQSFREAPHIIPEEGWSVSDGGVTIAITGAERNGATRAIFAAGAL